MKRKPIEIQKLTAFKAPEGSPGYLLWRVSTQWRSTIEDALRPLDLTHPQFVVLATTGWLTKDNAKIRQTDVCKAAGLDPNTTSQVLRGLEAKKLIKRRQTLDERSKSPMLTEAGSEKLTKALPTVERADKKYFDQLDSKELHALIKIFQKLVI